MLLQPAKLAFASDGTPYSELYDDVYYTRSGGLGQARHVFLGGNGLPERWRGRERFTIVETGFGLGLNFLTTWAAWQDDAQRCRRLHFVSFEKHPFSAADLTILYAQPSLMPLAPLAKQLLKQWPLLTPGFHRLYFADESVVLTLVFGDAATTFAQLSAQADAFYLDGFSPAKNADLWSSRLCTTLSRLAARGATLATWSVAAELRESLTESGWSLVKAPGFSGKRHMLRGEWHGRPYGRQAAVQFIDSTERHAIVIGAGLAGSGMAERLAAHDWTVDVVERAAAAGQGASGNRAGVLRPQPALDDNPLARLTRNGFLYARRHFAALMEAGLPLRWGACGVLHLARDATHEAAQRRLIEKQKPPADYLRFVERAEATQIAGWPVSTGGWWFPGGAWVAPASVCAANLARHGEAIRLHFDCHAERIACHAGRWHVVDAMGKTIAAAPVLILANAADARRFAPSAYLPLRSARGQVSHLPATVGSSPEVIVSRLGYATPAIDGVRSAGASFFMDDEESALRIEEHEENLAKLDFSLPGYAAGIDPKTLDGRVGFRPLAPDRLPMIGAVADVSAIDPARPAPPLKKMPRLPGLYVVNAFGARGIVWSALAGELLVSQIEANPLPVETKLVAALDPGRFLLPGKVIGGPLTSPALEVE